MEENPYQAPEAPLEAPPAPDPAGLGLPWEDRSQGGAFARALATVRLILANPEDAGQRISRSRAVGRGIAFYALAGLSFQWLTQLLSAVFTPLDGSENAWWMKLAHLPVPPPPTPEQMAFAKVMLWVGVAMAPIAIALGVLITGLMAHLGLWMVKGLEEKRGLETTFRSVLYAGGATAWLGLLNALGLLLPRAIYPYHMLFSIGLAFLVLGFQGLVLGHSHGLKPWKGVLAIFLPIGIIACCLGACLAPIVAKAAGGS